jgi:hypothetical protein
MSEFPKPTLQAAVKELAHRDEFKTIVGFIRDEREALFLDLGPAENPFEVMKIAGGIGRLTELLQTLDPPG